MILGSQTFLSEFRGMYESDFLSPQTLDEPETGHRPFLHFLVLYNLDLHTHTLYSITEIDIFDPRKIQGLYRIFFEEIFFMMMMIFFFLQKYKPYVLIKKCII